MAYYAPRAADEPAEAMASIGGAGGAALADHAQRRRFLRAGRILVAGGWLVLVHATIIIGNRDANPEHALAGFALLLLGVLLIALSPVASRFPGAARFGAAVAGAVIRCFAPGAGQ